ncbi:MAG: M28 family peptidase [Arenimonas sp.]|nr:M28 family peptidase [Arenimonas sp.]MBP7981485.1 M28 family peptidase [Arenimonas sp.]
MKPISLLLLSLGVQTAFAAPAPSFDPQQLSKDIQTLSSDAYEGRAPDSAGETKTVAFLIEQFKAAGLQPGGDLKDGQRGWTQAVPLGKFQIKGPVTASISVNGKSQALQQGEQIAIRAAMNGQSDIDIQNAPLVFVGYGVNAAERGWDDFRGLDLKGKIAIVLINDPDFETGQGEFGGKAMTYYGRWTYKFEEMARRGAAGTLIVHETAPASYGWPTVKNSNTNIMFDIVRKEPAKAHAPIEAWIQRDFAASLFQQAGLDFEALKRSAQKKDFKPVLVDGVNFSARFSVDAQRIVSQNVAALLPGSRHPEQTIIYSGHWDHLGIGAAAADGDTIYNGAVDNATGMAAMLELARAYGKAPAPERSVLFLAVTAEEKGLLGSEYYAANPLYPLGKTVAMINMDALGVGGPARNFTISGNAQLELLDQLISTAKQWDLVYSPDPKPEAGHFFRSDHFPLAKRGVPAISFGSGEDLLEGGTAAGAAAEMAYNENKYHQPSDEWQADWPLTGMARDLQVLYTLGRDLAESSAWPNWSADSEFRNARDASAAERGN